MAIWIYIVIAILELGTELVNSFKFRLVMKPLLMPALAFVLWQMGDVQGNFIHQLVLAGLFFSWIGDIFLMFEQQHEPCFLVGLGSFLIAHICYIAGFYQAWGDTSIVVNQPWFLIPFLLYAFFLLKPMFSKLGPMKIPVVVYALVIMCMMLSALNLYGEISNHVFWSIFIGALLFTISDSMIAINKFLKPFPLAKTAIMSTYIAGQLMIVFGAIQLY